MVDDDNEMKSTFDENISRVNVDHYRKMVRCFIDMRRYQTALFWAEKVTMLTKNDPKDIYWQAQCMFLLKEYHRTAHIIKLHGLERTHLMCHCLAAESLFEAKEYSQALDILNSIDAEDLASSMIKSQKEDVSMEYFGPDETNKNEILASICFLKGKILEATDNRTLATECYVFALRYSVYCTEALDALVQHEMLMAMEEKELMDHLPINQQCSDADGKIVRELYESKLKKYYDTVDSNAKIEDPIIGNIATLQPIFEKIEKLKKEKVNEFKLNKTMTSQLRTNNQPNIISPAHKILNDLKNTSSYSLHSSLTRLIPGDYNKSQSGTPHTDSIQKIKSPSSLTLAFKDCSERLQNSIDLLVAKAEKYFYNCQYKQCLKLLDEILKRDPYHTASLTVQIGCLFELKEFNKLFYVAHKLVDLYPDQAISWYAVGSYYDLIGKSDPARRYLSKATTLDRLYGPAWLAYGHSFAKENEHDQAMAAYFKATQLMRGCHLPLLYIGVECGLTKNISLAEKFFYQALSIAPFDIFVLHELAVIKFEYEFYESAEEVFKITLDMVTFLAKQNGEMISSRWEPLLNNLGHCCRKNKKYEEALEYHRRALVLKPQNAATYTSIGFVQALMGKLEDAVDSFHKSLALRRDEIFTTTILKYVIEDLMEECLLTDYMENTEIPSTMEEKNQQERKEELLDISEPPPKVFGVKLKFDECESNASTASVDVIDTFDMSMDV